MTALSKELLQEYDSNDEDIVASAQETKYVITDYTRELMCKEYEAHELEAICIVYRSMFVYCRYLCGRTLVPWYIFVYPVTLNSY